MPYTCSSSQAINLGKAISAYEFNDKQNCLYQNQRTTNTAIEMAKISEKRSRAANPTNSTSQIASTSDSNFEESSVVTEAYQSVSPIEFQECSLCIQEVLAAREAGKTHQPTKLFQLVRKKNSNGEEATYFIRLMHEKYPGRWEKIRTIIENSNSTRMLLSNLLVHHKYADNLESYPSTQSAIKQLTSMSYHIVHNSLTTFLGEYLENYLTDQVGAYISQNTTQNNFHPYLAISLDSCLKEANLVALHLLMEIDINFASLAATITTTDPTHFPLTRDPTSKVIQTITCSPLKRPIQWLGKTKELFTERSYLSISGKELLNALLKLTIPSNSKIEPTRLILPCIVPANPNNESEFFKLGTPCSTYLHLISIDKEDCEKLNYICKHQSSSVTKGGFQNTIKQFFFPWKNISDITDISTQKNKLTIQEIRSILGLKVALLVWSQCKKISANTGHGEYINITLLTEISNALHNSTQLKSHIDENKVAYFSNLKSRTSGGHHHEILNILDSLKLTLDKDTAFPEEEIEVTQIIESSLKCSNTQNNKILLEVMHSRNSVKPKAIKADDGKNKRTYMFQIASEPLKVTCIGVVENAATSENSAGVYGGSLLKDLTSAISLNQDKINHILIHNENAVIAPCIMPVSDETIVDFFRFGTACKTSFQLLAVNKSAIEQLNASLLHLCNALPPNQEAFNQSMLDWLQIPGALEQESISGMPASLIPRQRPMSTIKLLISYMHGMKLASRIMFRARQEKSIHNKKGFIDLQALETLTSTIKSQGNMNSLLIASKPIWYSALINGKQSEIQEFMLNCLQFTIDQTHSRTNEAVSSSLLPFNLKSSRESESSLTEKESQKVTTKIHNETGEDSSMLLPTTKKIRLEQTYSSSPYNVQKASVDNNAQSSSLNTLGIIKRANSLLHNDQKKPIPPSNHPFHKLPSQLLSKNHA